MTQHKTKPGGQIGNQNARKHGFYSSTLTPAEASLVSRISSLEGLDPEIALLRVKLQSSLQRNPANRRVLTEASRLLAKWYSAQCHLDRTDRAYLKTIIDKILETALMHHSPDPTGPST